MFHVTGSCVSAEAFGPPNTNKPRSLSGLLWGLGVCGGSWTKQVEPGLFFFLKMGWSVLSFKPSAEQAVLGI